MAERTGRQALTNRAARRNWSEGAGASGGMVFGSHVFAELAAESLLTASHQWVAHPDWPASSALSSMAMLYASVELWTGERLAWISRTAKLGLPEETKKRHEQLIYGGRLTEKFAALRRLGPDDEEAVKRDDSDLDLLWHLRNEIMHPLPTPQGLPPYLRTLGQRGLLVRNEASEAYAHLPTQLIASYPLAWWTWDVANEACLAVHDLIGDLALTSNYQLPVGMPVPPPGQEIRWHDGEGNVGSPPANRWEGRLP